MCREHIEADLRDTSTSDAERQHMLDILKREQRQRDAPDDSGTGEDDDGGGGAEEGSCELSEATLTKLLLRVRLKGGAAQTLARATGPRAPSSAEQS